MGDGPETHEFEMVYPEFGAGTLKDWVTRDGGTTLCLFLMILI